MEGDGRGKKRGEGKGRGEERREGKGRERETEGERRGGEGRGGKGKGVPLTAYVTNTPCICYLRPRPGASNVPGRAYGK